WHELRNTERAGIGALNGARVGLELARQQQELRQLLAEEVGAARIGEAEREQGVERRVLAAVRAVARFDPDDRHDQLGRHAVTALGARERVPVLLPVAGPEPYAFL